jgi:hypothetical protein
MPLTTEVAIVIFIAFFLAFLGFISAISEYKIADVFDFLWFGGSLLGLATACALNIPVVGGIACGGAVTIFGAITFLRYILWGGEYFKLIIFLPLIAILLYVISRLIRGGG